MHITSLTLQTIAWSALVSSTARAQSIIENLSFGYKEGQPISPNLRGIPHWFTKGDGYEPEILSDRVLLTPPYPGNKRGALWTEDTLQHAGDWTAELHFRASGIERGGGNLQIWYTRESQKGQAPNSLYTAPPFDGLVLVVDQYEGRGGSIRGFLNDGSVDIKAHQDPDTLAFGQCNYAYRNLGRLSLLRLHHANGVFEVTIDGHTCFSTDKVRLPDGYFFGITAASAENPDSFEVHKFTVSSTNAHNREEPNRQGSQQQPIGSHAQQQHHQQNQPQTGNVQTHDIPQMLSDVLAGSIRSQKDQFEDLHNRIQIMSHRVEAIHDLLTRIEEDNRNRHNDIMNKLAPVDDRVRAMMFNVEKNERISMEIQRDLESKDFKDMLRAVHNAIADNHSQLSMNMPRTVAEIVGKERPSLVTYIFIAVAVQIMVFGGYILYKKRRNNAPKKYL